LDKFQEELIRLKEDEEKQTTMVSEFKKNIYKETRLLQRLEKQTKKTKETFDKALAVLKIAQALTNKTRLELEEAIEAERQINKTVVETQGTIAALVEQIEKANAVKITADGLKIAVTSAMVSIVFMYEDVVGKPLKDVGFGVGDDAESLKQYWVRPQKGDEVEKAVQQLDAFCSPSGDGGQAFKAVPANVEPNPDVLCKIGDPKQWVDEVNETVKRIAKESLNDVLAISKYLEPLAHDLTVDKEVRKDQTIEMREPGGLEAIIGNTTFYRTYLRHWYKNDKESFKALIEKLGMHIEDLNNNKILLEAELEKLLKEQLETMNKTRLVMEALRRVIEDEQVKQSVKESVQQLFEDAKREQEAKEKQIDDMKEAQKTADERLNAITAELVNTHGEAFSFLQRVDKLHETGALYAPYNKVFQQVEGSPALEALRNRK